MRGTISGIPDSPMINKNVSQDAFGSIPNGNTRHLFVCIGCNTPLFTSKDIIDTTNTTATTSSSAHRNNKQSNNYYIKQREWMQITDGTNQKKSSGPLTCYRKVCRKKLGQFNLDG